ncbi:DUF6541 family protein [Gleimia europaea]|uniref:Uncharacterized protein n=1 Tax=Gleimia europaea ACS-120-V-Col10b TaxID=883069 RepID=A0A9W5REF8_9ACTO|nr:hypothetical protein HMPREF9238_00581 [Gleimia europaea ACS-120-V-Col10b]
MLLSVLAIIVIPGAVISTVLFPKASPILRLATAPAWSVGLIFLWSLFNSLLPFRWGLIPFIGFTLFAVAGAWILARTSLGKNVAAMIPQNDLSGRRIATHLLMTMIVWIAVILPVILTINPFDIVQGGDSSYHYNQLWLMEKSGNASPLNSNATMAGLSDVGWYYPNTWHAMLSLVTSGSSQALTAVNVLLLVTPLLWLVGVGTWSVAIGGKQSLYEWSFLGAVLAPIAMIRLELETTLWPFVLGMVIMPGMMALWYYATKTIRRLSSARDITLSIFAVLFVTAVPILGLIGIHPSTMLLPSFAFFVYLLFELIRVGVIFYKRGNKQRAARNIAGALFLFYLMMFVVDGPTPARNILFHRFPKVGWDSVPEKLFASATLYMPYGGVRALSFYGLVLVLLIAALFVAYRRRRWIMLAGWLSQWLLVIGTFFPIPGLSRITSLYYNYPDRPKAALAIFVVPLFALLADTIWNKLVATRGAGANRYRGVAVMLSTLLMYAWIAPAIAQSGQQAFHPDRDNVRFLADEAEIAMIKRAKDTLPPGAVVMGDPAAGAALLQPLSNVKTVWPYPNSPENREDVLLLQNFKDIKENARICEILEEHNIEYFYADKPSFYNGQDTDMMRPGLYGVPLNSGFEKIDEGGSAAIYKINFCSSAERPDYYPFQRTASTCILQGTQGACVE